MFFINRLSSVFEVVCRGLIIFSSKRSLIFTKWLCINCITTPLVIPNIAIDNYPRTQGIDNKTHLLYTPMLLTLIFSPSHTINKVPLLHKVVTINKVHHLNNIINNHNQCTFNNNLKRVTVDVVLPSVVPVVPFYVVVVPKTCSVLCVKI